MHKMKATKIKKLRGGPVCHYLWKLSEPLAGPWGSAEYAITSVARFTDDSGIVQGRIWPADEAGDVLDWGELPGSVDSDDGDTQITHDGLIAAAGWVVA